MRPYLTAIFFTLGGAAVALAAIDQPVKLDTGLVSGTPGKIPKSGSSRAFLTLRRRSAICVGSRLSRRRNGTACGPRISSATRACRAEPEEAAVVEVQRKGGAPKGPAAALKAMPLPREPAEAPPVRPTARIVCS